jgi:hypothetical protein
MEQSPSWEADRSWDSQENPYTLWNPEVYYRVYKSPTPVPIYSQINLPQSPIPLMEDQF